MLLIDNEVVRAVLTMRDCIAVQERAFAGTLTGASVSRPRLDTFSPCDREDGYYRWGSPNDHMARELNAQQLYGGGWGGGGFGGGGGGFGGFGGGSSGGGGASGSW